MCTCIYIDHTKQNCRNKVKILLKSEVIYILKNDYYIVVYTLDTSTCPSLQHVIWRIFKNMVPESLHDFAP